MNSQPIRLAAIGDIMFCRDIEKICMDKGYEYPFSSIAEMLRSYDIVLANLENPVSTRGTPAKKNPGVTFRAHPSCMDALKFAGINVVSLANNHMNDYGEIALRDTLDLLDKSSISYVGAGINAFNARKPLNLTIRGTRFSFLAYHHLFGLAIRTAHKNRPGIAQFIAKQCLNEIIEAKKQCDHLIVSIHWGVDYYDYPCPYYIDISRQFIDAGCDVILGHHSHVLQGYEEYNGGLIYYGLGNLLFDDPNPTTHLSAIFELTFARNTRPTHRIIPVFDDGSHRIQLATGALNEAIHQRILHLSADYRKSDWKGVFQKDPTDRFIWSSLRSMIRGGSLYHFRCFPLALLLKRSFSLIAYKIRQHIFRTT